MSRTPSYEPLTSVNFRMPELLLKQIEEIAHKKHHDRTTEINDACRHWKEIGGEVSAPILAISEFEKKIDNLTNLVSKQLTESATLNQKVNALLKELEDEKKQLLRIIEEGVKRR